MAKKNSLRGSDGAELMSRFARRQPSLHLAARGGFDGQIPDPNVQVPSGPGMDRAGFLARNPNVPQTPNVQQAAATSSYQRDLDLRNAQTSASSFIKDASQQAGAAQVKALTAPGVDARGRMNAATDPRALTNPNPAGLTAGSSPTAPAVSAMGAAPGTTLRSDLAMGGSPVYQYGSNSFGDTAEAPMQRSSLGNPSAANIATADALAARSGQRPTLRMASGGEVSPFSLRGIAGTVGGVYRGAVDATAGAIETVARPFARPSGYVPALAQPAPVAAPVVQPVAQPLPQLGGVDMNAMQRREAAAGLRDGGDLRTGHGGHVPGKGQGDKIPAKYEPGEFVVSNDMLDAQPGLREQLRDLRGNVLAAKGITPEQADAQAMQGGKLHAEMGAADWAKITREELAAGQRGVQAMIDEAKPLKSGALPSRTAAAVASQEALMAQPRGEVARFTPPPAPTAPPMAAPIEVVDDVAKAAPKGWAGVKTSALRAAQTVTNNPVFRAVASRGAGVAAAGMTPTQVAPGTLPQRYVDALAQPYDPNMAPLGADRDLAPAKRAAPGSETQTDVQRGGGAAVANSTAATADVRVGDTPSVMAGRKAERDAQTLRDTALGDRMESSRLRAEGQGRADQDAQVLANRQATDSFDAGIAARNSTVKSVFAPTGRAKTAADANETQMATAKMQRDTQLATNAANNATTLRGQQMSSDTQLATTGMNNRTTLRGQDLDYEGKLAPVRAAAATRARMSAYATGAGGAAVDPMTSARAAYAAGDKEAGDAFMGQADKTQSMVKGGKEIEKAGADQTRALTKGWFNYVDDKGVTKSNDALEEQASSAISAMHPNFSALSQREKDAVQSKVRGQVELANNFRDPQNAGILGAIPHGLKGTSPMAGTNGQMPAAEVFRGAKTTLVPESGFGAFASPGIDPGDVVVDIPSHGRMVIKKPSTYAIAELKAQIDAANKKPSLR